MFARDHDERPVRVLLLAGMGRSGTTLVERVVAGLPGVVALGEVVHLWRRGVRDDEMCGCGAAFSDCAFWAAVGDEAFGGWASVDVGEVQRERQSVDRVRHVPTLVLRDTKRPSREVLSYGQRYARLYRAVRSVTGCSLIVDSSKQASLPHVLAQQPDIDLRVLHVVRDARAVCSAWTKEVRRPEAHEPAYMPRYSTRAMAVMWSSHNLAVEALRLRGASPCLLRYEDFVADPVAAVTRVAAFGGLMQSDPPLHVRHDSVDLGVDHTAAGNPMRFAVGTVPLRRDDAWRDRMSVRQRRLVTALTWPLLLRYRYPLSSEDSR